MGIRVLIDARVGDGTAGGVQQFILGLAWGLSRLQDGDEEYLFLARRGASAWLEPFTGANSRIVYAPAAPGGPAGTSLKARGIAQLRRLGSRLKEVPIIGTMAIPPIPASNGLLEAFGASVVHFTAQAAMVTGLPYIYHPHDLQHLHLPDLFTRREWKVRERRYRYHCANASLVAVASSWVRDDVMRAYRVEPSRIAVIPLAPPVAAYPVPSQRDIDAARAKFGLPEQFVFFPAQTWRHKNHEALLHAVARLRDREGVTVPVVFTGHQNEYAGVLKRIVADLRLEAQTQFLGFVSPLELQSLYRLCRAVVIPTRFEAASFPLWEAFQAGAPVACSNVTSLPAQAADAALIFDPNDVEAVADATLRLWTDGELREELVSRGRANVARRTWERTASMFRAHYRSIAGSLLSDADRRLLAEPPDM